MTFGLSAGGMISRPRKPPLRPLPLFWPRHLPLFLARDALCARKNSPCHLLSNFVPSPPPVPHLPLSLTRPCPPGSLNHACSRYCPLYWTRTVHIKSNEQSYQLLPFWTSEWFVIPLYITMMRFSSRVNSKTKFTRIDQDMTHSKKCAEILLTNITLRTHSVTEIRF